MLAFSNISYKTGWTSSLAEEAMIRYSFDQIDYRTCKMVIDSANENIRIYNNLLETMFNVTIARKEKKPLYAI
ncbi:MAG TPA: hypothetical protein PKM25_19365 [Candidatus Ozemobacteraceae bacterium]|nr:hypothetical protein [Candidatus Ozemobacteraceae bacterium]